MISARRSFSTLFLLFPRSCSSAMPDVLILTGPPGAGKSTSPRRWRSATTASPTSMSTRPAHFVTPTGLRLTRQRDRLRASAGAGDAQRLRAGPATSSQERIAVIIDDVVITRADARPLRRRASSRPATPSTSCACCPASKSARRATSSALRGVSRRRASRPSGASSRRRARSRGVHHRFVRPERLRHSRPPAGADDLGREHRLAAGVRLGEGDF